MAFGEIASRYDMQVQVKNSLPSAGAIIDDQAKGIGNTQLLRHFSGSQHQVAQKCLVIRLGID
jgi:hypothetical protein